MPDWISFWDSPNWIYVNERHRQVHYRRIAEDIRSCLRQPDMAVLDYGCGEALRAERIAEAARRLILCDAAPNVREALKARFAGNPAIAVLSPGEVGDLANGALDLIVMHSVAQYLTAEELQRTLALFRRLLKPEGYFILGDVIPPDVSAMTDAGALLGFAAANGFFFAALSGLTRTAFSDYRKLRKALGVRRYAEADITAVLTKAGFSVRRAPMNLGHNQARMSFIARPA